MKQMTSEVKRQQLEWRRARVLDLTAVNRDIQFLRQRAQENLQRHIHETVPEEYQKCMVGMKRNLKQTLEIADTAVDPKVKLQARAIANDCYKYIMDLTTNGSIVTDAIKYVTQKAVQVNTLQKLDERIEAIEEEGTIGC
jgi:hypothetical protein